MTAQRSLGAAIVPSSAEDRLYRDKLDLNVKEFQIVVATLAHERVFGVPPTRLALLEFLDCNFDSQRLVRRRFLDRTDTIPSVLSTTAKAHKVLGIKP